MPSGSHLVLKKKGRKNRHTKINFGSISKTRTTFPCINNKSKIAKHSIKQQNNSITVKCLL